MLNNISILFLFFGVAVLVGGGGLPIGGFKNNNYLSRLYVAAKTKGEKPTADQQGAYYTELCYRIGGGLIALSILLHLLNLILR
jgi:hypothetical protein